MRITGRMPGRVMCQILRSQPAPSMAADSYWPMSIDAIAARKMIVPQPQSFQMAWAVISSLKVPGSVITLPMVTPCSIRSVVTEPAPPSTCLNIATTTTHDRKCGR